MKSEFLQKVSGSLSKAAFKLKKASPELLIVGGAVGVIAAAVGACCATRKVDKIIEEHRNDIQRIHNYENNEMYPEYSQKDAQKDLTITYARTTWHIVKLYAPSVLLGVTSLGCMLASNQILRKRNAALAAAYTAVDSAFKKYRKNVVERFGEAVDKELRFNTKAEQIEVEETDEKGKKKKVKKTVNLQQEMHPDLSCYARCFDETNPCYHSNPETNRTYIELTRQWAQKVLDGRGFIFLNEVYEHLGFPQTKAGQIVGWTKHGGDGVIDFGVYSVLRELNKGCINGYEPSVWLDFNVDGPILDMMP